jgi:hypothetical protein
MNVMAFPARDAGRILENAMRAADAAAGEQATLHHREQLMPWGTRDIATLVDEEVSRVAALRAAKPILEALTADEDMVQIVAYGMAEEAMIRLRKRGAV